MLQFYLLFTLLSLPGKAENLLPADAWKNVSFINNPVPCPEHSDKNIAILVAAGQSNLADSVRGDYVPKGNIIEFNPYDGKCYKHSTLERSSTVATRVAEKLIEQGPYDTVVLANFAIGGTDCKLWRPGEILFQRLAVGIGLLLNMKLSPTYLIWELGESDANFQTPPDDFRAHIMNIFNGIRKIGYKGPIYVAKSTRCLMPNGVAGKCTGSADKIRFIQADVVDIKKGIFPGPDTDIIQGDGRDWIQCHFSPRGADLAAQLWVDSILLFPKEKIQGTIYIDRNMHTTWAHACYLIASMEFHPLLSSQNIEGLNSFIAHRWANFTRGGSLEENIINYDYDKRLVETRSTNITEPDLPIRRLWTHSEFKEDGEKGSIFEWILYYDADPSANPVTVAQKLKTFLDAGLAGMKKTVEEASKPIKSDK